VEELPMAPSGAPTCPAAAKIEGACTANSGVICRVFQREHEQVDPHGMSAGTYGFTKQATGGVLLTMKSDPSSVVRFCHGSDLPVVTDEDGQARDSYTYCPIWQAEKERIWAGDDSITNEAEPESVSMGLADAIEDGSLGAGNPWAQARRDLDLLAPPR
jgi:hypothetical protein